MFEDLLLLKKINATNFEIPIEASVDNENSKL